MSILDLFAWIVLAHPRGERRCHGVHRRLAARTHRQERGHPWAQAVRMAGWITLFFGFALWPLALIWAYVDVPAPRRGSDWR